MTPPQAAPGLLVALAAIGMLAAVQAAAAAPRGFPAPSFHNYLADARFGKLPAQQAAASVGVASASSGLGEAVVSIASEHEYNEYYRGPEHPPFISSKQICLAEQSQKHCRSNGCQNRVTNGLGWSSDNSDSDPSNNCFFNGDSAGLGGMCLQGTGNCGSCSNCCFGNTCSFNTGDGLQEEPACYNCRVGNAYTSDFTCMKQEYYYGSDSPSNFFQNAGVAGSCDWSITWLRRDTSDTGTYFGGGNTDSVADNTCGWVELVPTRTYRVASATATCVFTNEAEMCGSPCSNRLMVTLQGEVYFTQAYSHQQFPSGIARNEDLCFDWTNIDNGDCYDTFTIPRGLREKSQKAREARKSAGKHAALPPGAGGSRAPQQPASAPAPAGQKTVKTAQAEGQFSGGHTITVSDQKVYQGYAVLISGTVTSINGQKYEGTYFNDGSFEYVPYWSGSIFDGGDRQQESDNRQPGPDFGAISVIDSSMPWVKPNTYKVEFTGLDGTRYFNS